MRMKTLFWREGASEREIQKRIKFVGIDSVK
jgi:hypothetical protein